jgi:hypothetical protein
VNTTDVRLEEFMRANWEREELEKRSLRERLANGIFAQNKLKMRHCACAGSED